MKPTLETLKKSHPGLFCGRPFAIGIHKQFVEMHPDISPQLIRVAMRFYCSDSSYQRAIVNGVCRINLDLSDGELPTDAERKYAVARLAAIKAKSKAQKLAKDKVVLPDADLKPAIDNA